jgi:preprotein translocase subunit YajC
MRSGNLDMFNALMLLADGNDQGNPMGGLGFFVPILLIFAAMYFILLRPQQRREQAQRLALLASLKKNDKVLTNGGIIGIVALVNEKEDEVTLKVDESSNVRLRVLKSSIIRNYTSEEAAKQQAAMDKAPKGKEEAVPAGKNQSGDDNK